MTPPRRLSDALLVEYLLVALRLGTDARPYTREVVRRGLVPAAQAAAQAATAADRRRLQ